MPKPVTPLVGCDVFAINSAGQVLLVCRADNGKWALPGGCQDLGETPAECAVREMREETGLTVCLQKLLGVFSSNCYEYINYPWKDNEFTHLLFSGKVVGGEIQTSSETTEVAWFSESNLPPLSDGHAPRIQFGFQCIRQSDVEVYFE